MNFEEIHVHAKTLEMISIIPAGFSVIGLLFCLMLMLYKGTEPDEKVFARIGFVALLVMGIVSFSAFLFATNRVAQNNEALISNIEQKYNVDEVKLASYGVITDPHIDYEQKIHLVVDDETYLFYLKQDRQTWEPTIVDPPINGGSENSGLLTAEDILKK